MFELVDNKEYARLAVELATIIRKYKADDSEAIQDGAEFILAAFNRIEAKATSK